MPRNGALTARIHPDLKVAGLSRHLVGDLDNLFPERCADPKDSDREIWMKAGERRLINYLKSQLRLLERPPEET